MIIFERIKMFPIVHFLSSALLAIILYQFYGYWCLAAFIGGFLIDVDHYFWYVIEKRGFNVIKCYKDMMRETKIRREKLRKVQRPVHVKYDMLHIFHVWEFWVLMFLLSLVHKFFFIIVLGMILHLVLDFYDMFKERIYGIRSVSFFYWLKRHAIRR